MNSFICQFLRDKLIKAPIISRLIYATLIGIFLMIPSFFKSKIWVYVHYLARSTKKRFGFEITRWNFPFEYTKEKKRWLVTLCLNAFNSVLLALNASQWLMTHYRISRTPFEFLIINLTMIFFFKKTNKIACLLLVMSTA